MSLNSNFLSYKFSLRCNTGSLKCRCPYYASQFKSKVAGKAPQYDLSKRLILTLSWNLAATVSRCTINLLRRWWTLLIPPISNWVPECGAASYSKPLINWRLILPIKSGILFQRRGDQKILCEREDFSVIHTTTKFFNVRLELLGKSRKIFVWVLIMHGGLKSLGIRILRKYFWNQIFFVKSSSNSNLIFGYKLKILRLYILKIETRKYTI